MYDLTKKKEIKLKERKKEKKAKEGGRKGGKEGGGVLGERERVEGERIFLTRSKRDD